MKNKYSIFGDDMSLDKSEDESEEISIDIEQMIIEKWTPILDVIEVPEKDKLKIAQYGEHFMELEEQFRLDPNIGVLQKSLLPLNLKALKEIKNFDITKDSTITEEYTFRIDFPNSSIDMEDKGMNVVEVIEEDIKKVVIQELKDKNLTIYLLISNMMMVETDGNPQVVVLSKIKINE